MVMNTPPSSQGAPPVSSANGSSSSSNSSGATATNSAGGGGTVLKKGPWTAGEDAILVDYVRKHGEGNWNAVRKNSGLARCGKSCRLRWANHLRPNLKKVAFSPEEERLILELHSKLGNKWARMATQLPGRTDNEIKNYWNTRIKRRQRLNLPLYPADIQQRHTAGHPSHIQRSPANDVAGGPSASSVFNCLKPPTPFPCLDPQRVSSLSPATLVPATTQFKSSYIPDSHFDFSGLAFPPNVIQPLPMPPPLRRPNGSLSVPNLDDLLRNATVPYDPDPLAGKLAFDFDVKPELPSSQSAPTLYTSCLFDGVAGGQKVETSALTASLFPTTIAEDNSGLLDAMLQEAQGVTGNEADKQMVLSDWSHGKDSGGRSFDVHWEDSRSIGAIEIKKETVTDEFYSFNDEFPTLLDVMPPPTGTSTAEWYGEGTGEELCNAPAAEVTASNPAPFSDDIGEEIQQNLATSPATTDQIWALNSCPWTNMPGIC